jgi:phosphoribosylformylglycinamidine (FGAM) synthase-like enzyme
LTVVRILIWNLADSRTSLDEVREQLPDVGPGEAWIANEAQERFGLVSTSDALPDLQKLRDLIGKEPDVAEEYDAL